MAEIARTRNPFTEPYNESLQLPFRVHLLYAILLGESLGEDDDTASLPPDVFYTILRPIFASIPMVYRFSFDTGYVCFGDGSIVYSFSTGAIVAQLDNVDFVLMHDFDTFDYALIMAYVRRASDGTVERVLRYVDRTESPHDYTNVKCASLLWDQFCVLLSDGRVFRRNCCMGKLPGGWSETSGVREMRFYSRWFPSWCARKLDIDSGLNNSVVVVKDDGTYLADRVYTASELPEAMAEDLIPAEDLMTRKNVHTWDQHSVVGMVASPGDDEDCLTSLMEVADARLLAL